MMGAFAVAAKNSIVDDIKDKNGGDDEDDDDDEHMAMTKLLSFFIFGTFLLTFAIISCAKNQKCGENSGRKSDKDASKRGVEAHRIQDYTLSGPSPDWEKIGSNSSVVDWDVIIRVQSDSLQNPENSRTNLKKIWSKEKF